MRFLDTIAQFIERQHLLNREKRYLVALSGGADSVCMLMVMHQMGYQIEAVHCNFHLRGDESNRDENFVKELCKQLHIELHLIHFDTITYAKTHQVSIEMAARELRYRYFEELRQDIGADGICVAHHQDDSVETILMNLLRGTARNKIRLNIIPQLKDINPSACQQILTTAQRLNEAAAVYDETMRETLSRIKSNDSIDVNTLIQEPSPESILFEWLMPLGFSPKIIESISLSLNTLQAGKEWQSASHQLTFNQGRLMVEHVTDELPTLRIPETGNYIYHETAKLRIELIHGQHIEKDPSKASLDASKVHFPLTLRPIRTGDRFQPFGMKGTKLVSDYLTDRHISIFEKRRTLVLCDRDGQIIWLVNHRPDTRFCINDISQETLAFSFFNTKK